MREQPRRGSIPHGSRAWVSRLVQDDPDALRCSPTVLRFPLGHLRRSLCKRSTSPSRRAGQPSRGPMRSFRCSAWVRLPVRTRSPRRSDGVRLTTADRGSTREPQRDSQRRRILLAFGPRTPARLAWSGAAHWRPATPDWPELMGHELHDEAWASGELPDPGIAWLALAHFERARELTDPDSYLVPAGAHRLRGRRAGEGPPRCGGRGRGIVRPSA